MNHILWVSLGLIALKYTIHCTMRAPVNLEEVVSSKVEMVGLRFGLLHDT